MLKAACLALLVAPATAIVGKYCLQDSDCANGGYCMDDATKAPLPVYLCHGGVAEDYCRGDGDCVSSYCADDPTKTPFKMCVFIVVVVVLSFLVVLLQ